MKASEMIDKLRTGIEAQGDLPVFYEDDGAQGEIKGIEVREPENELGFDSQFVDFPKRFIVS